MAQWVKDPALPLQQLGWLLWCEFDPWPGNFHMPRVWQKKKKKKELNLLIYLLKLHVLNLKPRALYRSFMAYFCVSF